MYKIEKNIPLPGTIILTRGRWNDLIKKMRIGDSVKLPKLTEVKSFLSSLKVKGIRGSYRKNGKGFRVWKLGRKKVKK